VDGLRRRLQVLQGTFVWITETGGELSVVWNYVERLVPSEKHQGITDDSGGPRTCNSDDLRDADGRLRFERAGQARSRDSERYGETFNVSKEFPEPVTFGYVVNGDTMMLDPVIPECFPACFEAAWSVIVAYPGAEWRRVE
jgi:hypothetical protein